MKNIFVQRILTLTPLLFFSACLKTRNDVKEYETKQVLQKQVVDLQKNTADSHSKFSDVEEQLRHMNGRLESVEARQSRSDAETVRLSKINGEFSSESQKKLNLFQEALDKMETQIQQNSAEIASLKSELAAQGSSRSSRDARSGKEAKKDFFELAQENFKEKDWKNAIIDFQKYRDKNPKGKHMAEATYKIGVCFQELGSKEDAKMFYQEVIASFPQSEESKKAKARLKGLK